MVPGTSGSSSFPSDFVLANRACKTWLRQDFLDHQAIRFLCVSIAVRNYACEVVRSMDVRHLDNTSTAACLETQFLCPSQVNASLISIARMDDSCARRPSDSPIDSPGGLFQPAGSAPNRSRQFISWGTRQAGMPLTS